MKTKLTLRTVIAILSAPLGLAQDARWKDDWKPSTANLAGHEYPKINSERRARFKIKAPDAKDVSVDIGKPLAIDKGEDGVWTITTSPLDGGFHFYRVLIDGASMTDPASEIFRGGGGGGLSSGIEVPTGEDFHSKMDGLLQSFVDDKKVSSVVGYVAQGGNVVYRRAFGWKDVENAVPAAVDDYFVLMSQTKAITTVAFMTLVEQGRVKIDDPVSKYFPEIPDRVVTKVHEDGTYETRPASSPMTFVHLMTHTSGLGAGLVRDIRRAQRKGDDAPAGFGGAIPDKVPSGQHSGGGDPNAKYLRDEMLALAKYPLGFDPGTKWNYHVSSNMLGYLIERISGKSLRDYVKETILIPLGMKETDWFYEPAALPRFVKAYRAVDGKLVPGSNMYSEGSVSEQQTYCEGAIGLNGPIEDYAKFCQMLLNRGELDGRRILRPETIELMTTIDRLPENSGAEPGFQFGLGFELHKAKKPVPAVSDSAFAWGGLMGTGYIVDPGHDLIALFYINMYGAEPVYSRFLDQAYRLLEAAPGRGR